MRPPARGRWRGAPRAPGHLPGQGSSGAADHLLKPARVSGGRAGALGCSAAEPPSPGPLPQTMGTAATRMQTRARPPAAAGPAAAPAHPCAARPAAPAPPARACASRGEAEEGAVPVLRPPPPGPARARGVVAALGPPAGSGAGGPAGRRGRVTRGRRADPSPGRGAGGPAGGGA